MQLYEIRDWLKGFAGADHYYIGKLDRKQPKSIGVYSRQVNSPPRMALGGLDNTSYDSKAVSLLVHWNENARETDEAAAALYNALRRMTTTTIADTRVYYVRLDTTEAVDVGTDDDGIYERVIWLTLFYERSK
ncbi:MAG: minor capsid protein [Eubacteriales bacterium]|nr:minor capsid protein [Eubacteriales bacterium]